MLRRAESFSDSGSGSSCRRGIGDSQNRPYMSVELCNLAGKGVGSRDLFGNLARGSDSHSSLGCLAHHSIGQNVSAKVGILSPLTEAPNMSENSSGQNESRAPLCREPSKGLSSLPIRACRRKRRSGLKEPKLYREIRIENVLTDEDGQEVVSKRAPGRGHNRSRSEHTTKKSTNKSAVSIQALGSQECSWPDGQRTAELVRQALNFEICARTRTFT